jgi:hypothetical protein
MYNNENKDSLCDNTLTTQFGLVQQEAIDRVTATLVCTESEARIALRHFRWNFDRLMGVHHERLCSVYDNLQACFGRRALCFHSITRCSRFL